MAIYKHILVALDLSDDSVEVARKAHQLATLHGAKLSATHVVEPLAFAYGGDVPLDMSEAQKIVEEQATIRLEKLLSGENIEAVNQLIAIGQTSSEIHRLAKAYEADMIIVGSHGRHGLAVLFGSTTNGVLHGAECDVLAVKV